MDRSSVLYQAMPAVGPKGNKIMRLIPVPRKNGHPSPVQLPVQKTNGRTFSTQAPVQLLNEQSFRTQRPPLRTNGISHPTQAPVQILDLQFFPTLVHLASGQAYPTQTQPFLMQTPVQVINVNSVPVQMPAERTKEQSFPNQKTVQIINSQMPSLRTDGQSNLIKTPQVDITVFNPLLQSRPSRLIGSSGLNNLPNPTDSSSLNKQSPQQKTVNLVAETPQTGSASAGCSVQVPVSVKTPSLLKSEQQNAPTEAHVPEISMSKHQSPVKDPIPSPSASLFAKCNSSIVVCVSTTAQDIQQLTGSIDSSPQRLRKLAKKRSSCDPLSRKAESQLFTNDGPPKKESTAKLKLIPKVSKRPNSPTRWVIEEMDGCAAERPSVRPPSSEPASSQKTQAVLQKEDAPSQTLQENPCIMYDGRLFYEKKKGGSAASQLRPSSSSSQQPDKSAEPLINEVIDLCGDDCPPTSNMSAIHSGDEDNVIFVSYVPSKSTTGCGRKDGSGRGNTSSRTDASGETDGGQVQSTSVGHDEHGAESLDPNGMETRSSGNPNPEEGVSAAQISERPAPAGTSTSESCQKSDHQLRNVFGIKADIKICLQKIDEESLWCVSANFLQSTSGVHVERDEMLRSALEFREVSSSHSVTLPDKRLNTDPQCVSKENCCSGLEITFLPEAESVFGYVEPIDEDFLDESDLPQLQDTPVHPQTCAEANTRRVGRTRKRTMCPCCVPAILLPVIRSASSWEEAESWMSTMEQMTKRGGRTKTARKDGKTSTRIRHPSCGVHKPPAGSSSSAGSEGLKRHEEIRRHNEQKTKRLQKL